MQQRIRNLLSRERQIRRSKLVARRIRDLFNDKKAGDGSLLFERKRDFLKYALAIKLTSSSILA